MPFPSNLYVSYGMPKSGSTLAFELARTMMELAGLDQSQLSCPSIQPESGINFAKVFDQTAIEELKREAHNRPGPCAIKTHSKLFPRVASELNAGTLFGHAVCRDPRDIALSMLDAAREGRAWGTGPNGPLRTVQDTIPRIRTQVKHFLAWAACDNILPLHYEQVAFNTETTAARIAAQLGIEVDIPKAIDRVMNQRFTQKNRATPQRWKSEMAPADASIIAREFSDFIETHCSDIPTTPVILGRKSRLFPFFKAKKP